MSYNSLISSSGNSSSSSKPSTGKGENDACLLRKQQLLALYRLPLYSLPTELVLCFLSFLELAEYPPIISASHHFLYIHGLMPYLPAPRLHRLLARLRWPLRRGSCASPLLGLGLGPRKLILPPELCIQIQDYLDPEDKIALVLATFA